MTEDATPHPRPLPDLVGGRYQIVSRVGVGGMGVVYKAIDRRLNRPVAVKALEDRRLLLPGSSARLRTEALSAASLDHPYICKIYELLETGTETFIVMEFVEGETLASMLHRGAIALDRTLQIGREVAEGLADAHGRGVVHRDVKPSNVMVTASGHVKLLDFGVSGPDVASTPGGPTRTLTPQVTVHAGTPQYMAPEQATGQPVTARADVFSLGVVLYECLTGALPFSGATTFDYVRNMMQSSPRRLDRAAPETPAALVDLVERCLEKTPANRPEAAEVVTELRRISGALTSPGVSMPSARQARAGRRWQIVAGLALLVAAIAVVWRFSTGGPASAPLRQSRSFVTSPAAESDSRVSPDGQWVSFLASSAAGTQVMVQQVDGGEPRPLTLGAGRPVSQTWSPDGRHLACVLRQQSGLVLQIYPAFFGGAPQQSFTLDSRLAQVDVLRWIDHAAYLEVTDGRGRVSLHRIDLRDGAGTIDLSAAWALTGQVRDLDISPDGGRVALVLADGDRTDLWTANVDGSAARQLTDDTFFERHPLWNGRGDRILFQSNRGGQIDLWEIDARTQSSLQLTSGAMEEVAESTSADGSLISFRQLSQEARLWRWGGDEASGLQLTQDALNDYSAAAGAAMIAFQRGQPAPSFGHAIVDAQLFVAPFEKGAITGAPRSIGGGFAPALAPAGAWMAYLRHVGAPQVAGLMMRNLTSGASVTVSSTVPMPISSSVPLDWAANVFTWSHSGATLVFVERATGSDRLTIRHIEAGTGARGESRVHSTSADELWRDLYVADGDRQLAYVAAKPGMTELRLLGLAGGGGRTIATWNAPFTAVFGRGWLEDSLVIVRRVALHDDRSGDVEVSTVDAASGRVTVRGSIAHAFIATSRLDAVRRVLYVTRVDNGIHNLYSFGMATGTLKKLTQNTLVGVTFSGFHPLDGGSLVGTREERRQDIWLIQEADRVRSGSSAGR